MRSLAIAHRRSSRIEVKQLVARFCTYITDWLGFQISQVVSMHVDCLNVCLCVCVESELTYQFWIVFEEKCDLSESLGLVLVYFWQGTDLLGPPSNQHRHLNTSEKPKKENVLSVGNHHSTAHARIAFWEDNGLRRKEHCKFWVWFALSLSTSLPVWSSNR